MEGLFAGLLLLFLVKRGGDASTAPTTPHGGSTPPPSTPPAGGERDVGKDISTGISIATGTLTAGIGMAKALGILGGSGAAAGAGGAGAAGAGAGAGAGGAGISLAPPTGAGATVGASGSTSVLTAQQLAAAFWASGAGGALTFLAIAAAIVAIVMTQKQQAYAKAFSKKLGRGRPNPRELADFERTMLEKVKSSESTPVREARDVRLDVLVNEPGYSTVLHGRRPVYQVTTTLARRIRSMAYEFLRERHRYTFNLRSLWPGLQARPSKTLQEEWSEAFNDPMGFANVPLLHGHTQIPRVDPSDPYPRDNREQLQPLPIVLPGDWSLEPGDRIIARLLGLLDAIGTLNADSDAYVYFDAAGWRREYRDKVFNALGLVPSVDAELVDWVESSRDVGNTWRFGFITNPSKWGLRVRVDVDDPKRGGITWQFRDFGEIQLLHDADGDAAREAFRQLVEADAATIPAAPTNSVSNIR